MTTSAGPACSLSDQPENREDGIVFLGARRQLALLRASVYQGVNSHDQCDYRRHDHPEHDDARHNAYRDKYACALGCRRPLPETSTDERETDSADEGEREFSCTISPGNFVDANQPDAGSRTRYKYYELVDREEHDKA